MASAQELQQDGDNSDMGLQRPNAVVVQRAFSGFDRTVAGRCGTVAQLSWPCQTGQTVSGAAPVPNDGLEKLEDEDGIAWIPSVRGEAPAAEGLRSPLAVAYGKAGVRVSWTSC